MRIGKGRGRGRGRVEKKKAKRKRRKEKVRMRGIVWYVEGGEGGGRVCIASEILVVL